MHLSEKNFLENTNFLYFESSQINIKTIVPVVLQFRNTGFTYQYTNCIVYTMTFEG